VYGKGGCAGWVVGGGGREGGRRRNQGRSECDSGLVGWWRDLAEEGNAANFAGLSEELREGLEARKRVRLKEVWPAGGVGGVVYCTLTPGWKCLRVLFSGFGFLRYGGLFVEGFG
jgi:hypothetical protein